MKNLMTSAAMAVALLAGTAASAQDYPSKPITLVAPYGAGGASDMAARALAQVAEEYMGQPIRVENRPGAGGMVGARSVADAEADGYTVLLMRPGMVVNPASSAEAMVDYDEYTYLGLLEVTPMLLTVQGDSEIETVEQLMTKIKENPGTVAYAASGGVAVDGYTTQAALLDAGLNPLTDAILVPYQGGNALATAVAGGHVQFGAWAAASQMPMIESGDLRPIAVYAPERLPDFPDVPTMAELGYDNAAQVSGWSAVAGPEGLPEDVVAKWNEVLAQVAEDETWLDLAAKRGSTSVIGTVDMTEYADQQYELYNKMAVDLGYLPAQ